MPEHIPAWKRIGLEVQKELAHDPLAASTTSTTSTTTTSITTTTDITALSKKQAKNLKRSIIQDDDDISPDTKKPPKRQKVPKDQKAPPPEKDQLVYLRQFTEDHKNWKFQKSKQNWILKKIFYIDSKYDTYLKNYVQSIQGASKERLLQELRELVIKWNDMTEKLEAKMAERLEKGELEEESKDTTTETATEEGKEIDKDAPVYDHAIRARDLIAVLTGEVVKLKGIDADEEVELEADADADAATNQGTEVTEGKNDNLVIQEVEVTDFITSDDHKDESDHDDIPEQEPQEPQQEDTNIDTENLSKKEKKNLKKKMRKEKKKAKRGTTTTTTTTTTTK